MAPERSRDRLNIAVASARAVTRSTIPGLTPHAGRTPVDVAPRRRQAFAGAQAGTQLHDRHDVTEENDMLLGEPTGRQRQERWPGL